MFDLTEQQFLRAVFCLSRSTEQLCVATIATRACLTATRSAVASISLGRAGLIDTDGMRLTMRGLAAAARLEHAAHLERRGRIRARAERLRHSRGHGSILTARRMRIATSAPRR